MNIALRPHLTSGVVLVGASVLVVAPLQIPPQPLHPPQVAVSVQSAALQEEDQGHASALEAFEIYARAVGDTAYGVSNWVGTTPAFLVDLARQIAEDPSKIPAALSAVIYRLIYLGPGVRSSEQAIAAPSIREVSLLAAAIGPLLRAMSVTLPAPLGGPDGLVVAAGEHLAKYITTVLTTLLPEPLDTDLGGSGPRKVSDGDLPQSPVDQVTDAIAVLANAVGLSARNTAYWVGALPAVLVSLTEQVRANPELLPEAFSTVVQSLFALPDYSPDYNLYVARLARYSLLGGMVDPYIRAFDEVLPAPFGSTPEGPGLVLGVAALFSDAVNGALRRLPPALPVDELGTGLNTTFKQVAAVEEPQDHLLELAEAYYLVVSGLGNSAGSVLTFIGTVPTQVTELAAILRANPDQLPNVLSAIAYALIALPDGGKDPASRAMVRRSISLLDAALTPLVRNLVQLPGPIGSTNGEPGAAELGMAALTKAVNNALRRLPEPAGAQAAFDAQFVEEPETPLRRFNADFATALRALGESVANVGDGLGAAPETALLLARTVAEDPGLLPRALSTVAWEANSLRVAARAPLVRAVAEIAPPPLGDDPEAGVRGIASRSFNRTNAAADRALSKLPEPLPIGDNNVPYLTKVATDDPADTGVPSGKAKRPLVSLDLKAKAHFGSASSGRTATQSDDDSSAKHRPGVGKRPVSDHIAKRVAERRAAATAK